MDTSLLAAALRPRPFYRRPADAAASVTTLPYATLKGPGFERLVYELLCARGDAPHYFGRSGQEQFGVDLVVESAAGTRVYQCKNVTAVRGTNIDAWLAKFEDEWLGTMRLPKPLELVICCPLDLGRHMPPAEWERKREAFKLRTGVAAVLWNVDYFDTELRGRPEIVASVFSDGVAAAFSGRWKDRLWIPVDSRARRRAGRGLGVGQDAPTRYFQALAARQLHVGKHTAAEFRALMAEQPHVMIRGPAGVGKSVTGIALASRLAGYRFRLYYSTLKWTDSAEELIQGCIDRCTLPTIFFLDDCDQSLERAEMVFEGVMARLPERALDDVRFILVKRGMAVPTGSLPLELERRFAEQSALLDLRPNRATFDAIVGRTLRREVDPEDLDRLWAVTGGDLYLLGIVIGDGSADLKELSVTKALRDVSARYFGESFERYEVVREIAALAQFEIVPHVSDFAVPSPAEEKALRMLAVTEQEPPRYVFVHSSAAELVFRALAQRAGIATNGDIAAAIGRHLETSRPVEERAANLYRVLNAKRKLPPHDDEALNVALLEMALPFVRRELEQIPARVPGRCLQLAIQSGVARPYLDLLAESLADGRLLRALKNDTNTRPLFVQLRREETREAAAGLQEWVADEALIRSFAAEHDLATFVELLATVAPAVAGLASRIRGAASAGPLGATCGGVVPLGAALADLRAADSASADAVEESIDMALLYSPLVTGRDLRGVISSLRTLPPKLAFRLIGMLTQADLDRMCDRLGHGAVFVTLKLRDLNAFDPAVAKALCYAVGTVRFARMTADPRFRLKDLTNLLERLPPRMRPFIVARVEKASILTMLEKAVERKPSLLGLQLRTLTADVSPVVREAIGELMCEERIVRKVAATAPLAVILKIASYLGRHTTRFFRAVVAAVPRRDLVRRRHSATETAIRVVNALRSPTVQQFFAGDEGTEVAVALLGQIRNPYWIAQLLGAFPSEVRDAVLADGGFHELVPALLRSGGIDSSTLLIRDFGGQLVCDLDAASSALRATLAEADWPTLRRALRHLDAATSALAAVARAELLLRVSALQAEPPCSNWIDAANRLAVVWTLWPDKRDGSKDDWASALPPDGAALRTADWILTLPLLVQLFAELSDEAAGALLRRANDPAAAEGIEAAHCGAAFNYLWNTYSLALDRGNVSHEEFAGWLAPAIADALRSKITAGIQKMNPVEAEPRVALRRLFGYVGLPAPTIPRNAVGLVRRYAAAGNGGSRLLRHFYTRGLAELGVTVVLAPITSPLTAPSRIPPAIQRLQAQEGFLSAE